MRRPLVWGTLFLVAGTLFLGLAFTPAGTGEAALASQAGSSASGQEAPVAAGAQLGLSLVSTLAGVGLVVLGILCYVSRFTADPGTKD